MSNITPFAFENHNVRVVTNELGEPWFVAADVCEALAIGNVSLAVNGRPDRADSGLDADERGIANVNTPSGEQQMLIINESGLYSLILTSRKPEAKKFKKWVTSEVLPAIRKTGTYSKHDQLPVPQTLPEALRLAADLAEQKEVMAKQLAIAAPKVEFANAVMNADGTTLVRDVAKTIGVGVRKLEKALRLKGVILPNNAPAAVYVEKGYFKESTHAFDTKTKGVQLGHTAKVTGKGIEFLRRFAVRHADMFGAAH